MSAFVMAGADVRVLLHHMALYGLGAMLDEAGVPDVRLAWSSSMQPLPQITGEGLTADVVDGIVREHARVHAAESSWVQRDVELNGKQRGLMSPRLTTFGSDDVWGHVQVGRERELQALTDVRAYPALRFLAALGEPAYWSRNPKGDVLQDDGASRLEMQPRNQGSEFVGTRLRKLAAAVVARPPAAVSGGLLGTASLGAGNPTGFASTGTADDPLMWCAVWGIGQFPTAARIDAAVLTSGHIGRSRAESFYAPVWGPPWRPARLRSVLASRQLRDAAATDVVSPGSRDAGRDIAARAWLAARGVVGIMRFPIRRFGSDSAPERRALRGLDLRTVTS